MLITEEYKELNRQLHGARADFGTGGAKWAANVRVLVQQLEPETILDYGCGQGTLAKALSELEIKGYDPAIFGKDESPEPADLVICTDVLEHIEIDCLTDVLDDLQRVTKKNCFFNVATRPAVKSLPDGRNTHQIIQPVEWWLTELRARFRMEQLLATEGEFTLIVKAEEMTGNHE